MHTYKNLTKDEVLLSGLMSESCEANGTGLRRVYFSQGCNHHCQGCFSPETWSFEGGKVYKISELIKKLDKDKTYLDGITFSGGDPIEQCDKFLPLAKFAKKNKLSVWAWTGYTWEELLIKAKKEKEILEFLKTLDVLVDGRFVFTKRDNNNPDETHKWRGSSNQRVIDVKKTLKAKKVVLLIK